MIAPQESVEVSVEALIDAEAAHVAMTMGSEE